jgi:hypothetical protein
VAASIQRSVVSALRTAWAAAAFGRRGRTAAAEGIVADGLNGRLS